MAPERAEFCPQCKAAMSRRLREARPIEPADDDLKAKRRNIFIVGAAFVFGLVIGGQAFPSFGPDIEIDPSDWQQRPAFVGAQELFDAYRDDEEEADEKFRNRGVVVSGEFVRIVHDGQGNPDLRLKTSDPENPLGVDLVQASFDESAELRPGQAVTVSCENVAQTGDEHWLQNCSIEEGPVAPAVPAPPTAAGPPTAPVPPSD
jgi:hypothetical protein